MGEAGGAGGRIPARAAANSGNGSANGSRPASLPTDPAELERLIDHRRQRLAATLDELAQRAQPKELARRGALDVKSRLRAAAYTDDGQLRVERVTAAAAATVTLLALLVLRRRSR